MQQKAATIVEFMRMTCGAKANDAEKETICNKFFDIGVQKFAEDNTISVDKEQLREYAVEIVYNAIEAFKTENIKSEIHVWRPYATKSGSSTSSKSSISGSVSKSSSPMKSSSEATSVEKKEKKSTKKETTESSVTLDDKENKLADVFETLSLTAKPTKSGLTGLKVDDLHNICEALGGADFIENIEIIHGKGKKPVKADLVDGIVKFLN